MLHPQLIKPIGRPKFFNIAPCIFIFLLLALFGCSNATEHENLTTNEAIAMINKGDIQEISIDDASVNLIDSDNQRYLVNEAPTDQVMTWLLAQGADKEQLAQIAVSLIVPPKPNSPWLTFVSLTPIPFMLVWISLIIVALLALGRRPVSNRIIWVAIILFVPFLGPLAFLLTMPNTNS